MVNAQQKEEVKVENGDALGKEEDLLAYLKKHDGEWLARTLRERCNQHGYHGKKSDEATIEKLSPQPARGHIQDETGPGTTLAGPYDVTAPELPSQWANNEHVALLRSFSWNNTELGPMSEWSLELRKMVNFTLQDRRSAVLWWGPMRRCKDSKKQEGDKHVGRLSVSLVMPACSVYVCLPMIFGDFANNHVFQA